MSDTKKEQSYDRLLVGGVLVFCIALISALILFFRSKNELAVGWLRYFFVVVFTLLPACMYYVFIASRKSSLFQEFVVNLNRLGLLRFYVNADGQQTVTRREQYINLMRVQSYVLRFEGVYGPVNKSLVENLEGFVECADSDSPSTGISSNPENPAIGTLFSFATAVPVLVATFLIGICWLMVLPPWLGSVSAAADTQSPLVSALSINGYAPLFGFLGAYFYSLQMLFRRYVTNDLRARAYVSVSMRIVLAVIGAWVLEVLFGKGIFGIGIDNAWIYVFAFIIGAFPPVLWRLIREAGSRLPLVRTAIPSMDSRLPVSELDGLTTWHQARLEEEDVENTYNMASADIIDLLVQTKIPPDRIIDWVDQAILYASISDQSKERYLASRNTLSNWGIRNASMLQSAVVTRSSAADGVTEPGFPDEFNLGKAVSLTRSFEGFSNYSLVKHWKNLNFE